MYLNRANVSMEMRVFCSIRHFINMGHGDVNILASSRTGHRVGRRVVDLVVPLLYSFKE